MPILRRPDQAHSDSAENIFLAGNRGKGEPTAGLPKRQELGCRGIVVLLGLVLCQPEMHPVESVLWYI